MRLIKVIENETGIKISYASYLKEDFVDRSLVIYLNRKDTIESMFFNSNRYGSVEWVNGKGLTECHTWETPDEAKSASYLTRRYTAVLSNGEADLDYAQKNIIADILENFDDTETADWIWKIINASEYGDTVDLSRFSFH